MLKKSFLGLLLSLSSLSVQAIDAEPYIVNGTNTTTSEYPSYVRLYYYQVGNFGFCGGTILSNQYVVTAAHCVDIEDESIGEVGLLFTSVIPNLDNQTELSGADFYYVEKFYIHSGYDAENFLNDIAVLKLETPLDVTSAAYANFASDENAYRDSSESFTAVGFGSDGRGGEPTLLQKATLTYVENADCNYYVGGAPSTQLCMEGAVTNGLENATCSGDSGGPLYWDDGSDVNLVGVTSYGPSLGCGSTDASVNATSVFSEVLDYSSWISNVMNGSVNATYTADSSDRDYYLANGSLPPELNTSSGGGGGSIPLWVLLSLSGLLLIRKPE